MLAQPAFGGALRSALVIGSSRRRESKTYHNASIAGSGAAAILHRASSSRHSASPCPGLSRASTSSSRTKFSPRRHEEHEETGGPGDGRDHLSAAAAADQWVPAFAGI